MFDKILSIIFSKKALIIFAILILLAICLSFTACDGLRCMGCFFGSIIDCYVNNCDFCMCLVDAKCQSKEYMMNCSENCGIECNEALGDCALSRCICLHNGCIEEFNRCDSTNCYTDEKEPSNSNNSGTWIPMDSSGSGSTIIINPSYPNESGKHEPNKKPSKSCYSNCEDVCDDCMDLKWLDCMCETCEEELGKCIACD